MVVVDENSDRGFVVMDLTRYEEMCSSEQVLTNRGEKQPQIDVLPKEQVIVAEPPSGLPNLWDVMAPSSEDAQTWDMGEMTPEEISEIERQYKEFAEKTIQEAVEEQIESQPDLIKETKDQNLDVSSSEDSHKTEEEEFGEEQFYLEPIE